MRTIHQYFVLHNFMQIQKICFLYNAVNDDATSQKTCKIELRVLNEIWQHFFFLFLQSFHLLHIKAIVYILEFYDSFTKHILQRICIWKRVFRQRKKGFFFYIYMVKKINPSMMRNTAIYLNHTHALVKEGTASCAYFRFISGGTMRMRGSNGF